MQIIEPDKNLCNTRRVQPAVQRLQCASCLQQRHDGYAACHDSCKRFQLLRATEHGQHDHVGPARQNGIYFGLTGGRVGALVGVHTHHQPGMPEQRLDAAHVLQAVRADKGVVPLLTFCFAVLLQVDKNAHAFDPIADPG